VKKPSKNLPDTNVIVRYLVKDDPALYKKAKEFFDKVKSGGQRAVILESVIAECIYVLIKIYKVPRDKAAGSLLDILHYKGIVNNDREELIASLNFFAGSNVDIVDCILLAKSKSSNSCLFSFDEGLNRFATSIGQHDLKN
jgi:predicted nucleic acid-binding protein